MRRELFATIKPILKSKYITLFDILPQFLWNNIIDYLDTIDLIKFVSPLFKCRSIKAKIIRLFNEYNESKLLTSCRIPVEADEKLISNILNANHYNPYKCNGKVELMSGSNRCDGNCINGRLRRYGSQIHIRGNHRYRLANPNDDLDIVGQNTLLVITNEYTSIINTLKLNNLTLINNTHIRCNKLVLDNCTISNSTLKNISCSCIQVSGCKFKGKVLFNTSCSFRSKMPRLSYIMSDTIFEKLLFRRSYFGKLIIVSRESYYKIIPHISEPVTITVYSRLIRAETIVLGQLTIKVINLFPCTGQLEILSTNDLLIPANGIDVLKVEMDLVY